jgi:hypothetical protein
VPSVLTPEPILPIELIALDIDGTLIGDDLVIGPDTRAAIRGPLARGVLISIVTGRMVSSAMRFARELELTAPVVGYQGAPDQAMPEPDSTRLGRLLHHHPIRAEAARDIVEWTRVQGLDPHINHLERFILREDDPNADDYSAFMGSQAELVPDLPGSIHHPVTKVLAVGEPPLPTDVARSHAPGSAVSQTSRSATRSSSNSWPRACQGAGGPLAGPASRCSARGDDGDRRPVERSRDARRGRSRGRHAERPAAVQAVAATSRRRWPRRASRE